MNIKNKTFTELEKLAQGIHGVTPLIRAADENHLDIVKYLIEEKKVNINESDYDGRTALIDSAEIGNVNMVKYMLEHGANIDLRIHLTKTIQNYQSLGIVLNEDNQDPTFNATALY